MLDLKDEGRKTAASTYLIDPSLSDYGKSGLEMQVHQQGSLNRRSNQLPSILNMDSPPQRTTASGTLTGASRVTIAEVDATRDLSRTGGYISSRCPKILSSFNVYRSLGVFSRAPGQVDPQPSAPAPADPLCAPLPPSTSCPRPSPKLSRQIWQGTLLATIIAITYG
jgi:hypothetical protein